MRSSTPPRPLPSLALLVVPLLSALLAGCGTTVPLSSRVATPDGTAMGATSTGGGGAGPATGAAQGSSTGPAPGTTSGSATSPEAGTGRVQGTSATGAGPGGGGGAVPVGRADGPIVVGFIASKCSNCSAALGTYAAPTYSDEQYQRALVDALNKQGGLAGRRITPVFATVDTASANWSTDFQAACSTFTEDHHVAVVLGNSFTYQENLGTCLSKAGIPWINSGYGGGDRQVYRDHPLYFTASAPSEDAELVLSVSSALRDGWVSSRSRLGIVQGGCPTDLRAFNNSLVPYLKAHHLNLVVNSTINCVNGASSDGAAVAAIQNAELKMRAQRVDNVIIVGIPLILFAENAQSQGYTPNYLAYLGGATYESYLPAAQLRHIHAAGWLPMLDVGTSKQPPLTAGQQKCKALYHAGGIDVPADQYNNAFLACDGLLLYAAAVGRLHGQSAGPLVAAALEQLGTSYSSAVVLDGATRFGREEHTAPHRFRSNLYSDTCSCFLYSGPYQEVPSP